jgi:hypothetical protein
MKHMKLVGLGKLGKTKAAILALLLATTLSITLTASVKAQDSVDSSTVGLWHLDEVKPDGYRALTPDAAGRNPGTLGVDPLPALVQGKFDKALQFDGNNFVYVPISFLVGFPPSPEPIFIPISPGLDVQKEFRIEAWINVQSFTNATYNNIVVKCTRSDAQWQNITRIVGLAVRSGVPEEGISVPQGALSGFVRTDEGGANEIVTTEPVITLNQWTHVAFTRTSSGMHLYVNGYEQNVRAISGVQNPAGAVMNGTEVYFGHDSKVTIDEIHISNLVPELQKTAQIDIGPNLLIAVIAISTIFAVAWLLRRAIQMWVLRSKP